MNKGQIDIFGAMFFGQIDGLFDGPGRIDFIIYNDDISSLYISDQAQGFDFVAFAGASFFHKGNRTA